MIKTAKVVIIDDDVLSIEVLKNALLPYEYVQIAATATNAEQGESAVFAHHPDLLFLDIELPASGLQTTTNGLEFLGEIQSRVTWDMRVVFYTSYEKYLLEALRANAFDFLLKPINQSDLSQLLTRFRERRISDLQRLSATKAHDLNERPLLITSVTNEKMVVRPHNIGYFRYNSTRKLWEVMLDDGRGIFLKHNTTADVILNYGAHFIQIHKIYIINLHYLNMIQNAQCVMSYPFHEADSLKVSKVYRKALLDRFYDI